MEVASPLGLLGNAIALVAVSWKTAYDLWWNPRCFRAELASGSMAELEAARRKRERGDRSTAFTFLVLAVSYAILIVEALR